MSVVKIYLISSMSTITIKSGVRPVYDDNQHFEMLTLEGAQAGLSWGDYSQ